MPHTAAPLVMVVMMVMMVPPCTCLPLTTFTWPPGPLVLVPPHPLALAYIHTPHNPLMKEEPGVVVIAEVEDTDQDKDKDTDSETTDHLVVEEAGAGAGCSREGVFPHPTF